MISPFFISIATTILSTAVEIPEHSSVGLEHMAARLRGDVRFIAMGDSYCGPYFARLPLASLRVWPIPKIMGVGGGAATQGHISKCVTHCEPVSSAWANDSSGYRVERQSKLTYFTLPLRELREIYTDASFNDLGTDKLFEFKFFDYEEGLNTGVHGSFIEPSDSLAFRFLFRCPSDIEMQLDEIKISDFETETGIINLKQGTRPYWHLGETPGNSFREAIPRQINASAFDYPANNDYNSLRRIFLSKTTPLAGTNKYFEPAGSIYYHLTDNGDRETGLYYSHISDNSWSYSGFGSDTDGSWYLDKQFSLEQFTHWLDVTTLDREQPTVFFWFFAPEPIGYDIAMERMTGMIEQAESAANLVGLTSIEHFIVIAPLFRLNDDIELSKNYIRHQQQVAFDLAESVSNVSAASLFAATDEVLFDGIGGVPWLLYHGFDHFEFGSNSINLIEGTNGDLFDQSVVHPGSPDAAAFFAAVLGEIIREAGCEADIIVDGYINTNDLLAVIARIGEEYVQEDINEDGIVDVLDILLVIDGWGECWPVQAPFNTPAFRSR